MAEGEHKKEGGGVPLSEKIAENNSDDITLDPYARQKFFLHTSERREDWIFFVIFNLILLDFVFFSTLKSWWPPTGLCIIQIIALFWVGFSIGWEVVFNFPKYFFERLQKPYEKRLAEIIWGCPR